MEKIYRPHLWRKIFIWTLCLPLLIVAIGLVFIVLGYGGYLVWSRAGWSAIWPLLIWLPFGLIIAPLMVMALRILKGNKLVLTDSVLEYYESGNFVRILYKSIKKITMGSSRDYFAITGAYQIRTPIIRYELDGKEYGFSLPHWISRKKVLKELAKHLNPEIIDKKVREKFGL